MVGVDKSHVEILSFEDNGIVTRTSLPCRMCNCDEESAGEFYFTTGKIVKTRTYGKMFEVRCKTCGDRIFTNIN